MNCANVRPLLDDYFEGLIPGRQAERIAEHLATCAACASELCQLELVAGALATVPRAAPPGDLPRAISLRIAGLPAPRQLRVATGWRWVGVIALASALCLSALGYLLPVLISEEAASGIAVLGQMREASVVMHSWFAAAPGLLAALWVTFGQIWLGFSLAARAAAPTLGFYFALEVGILAVTVFVIHSRSRRMPVRQTLLV
ncbi:MAG: anti-sigma factor [Armatimonadota bacterium]